MRLLVCGDAGPDRVRMGGDIRKGGSRTGIFFFMLMLPHLADNPSKDLQALGVVKGKAGSRDTRTWEGSESSGGAHFAELRTPWPVDWSEGRLCKNALSIDRLHSAVAFTCSVE